MKRSEIDAEVKRIHSLNVKWAHRGRSTVACDCIGLVILVGQHFDVPYVDMPDYGRLPDGKKFVQHLRSYLDIGMMPLKVGQIVVLRDKLLPCHCGIIVERHGELRMIHASAGKRRVVESVLDGDFWSRFRMALEFPSVEEDNG